MKQNRGKGEGQPPAPSCERAGFVFLEIVHFIQRKKGWKGRWKHFSCLQHSIYTSNAENEGNEERELEI